MANIYSIAQRTAAGTTTTPGWEVIAGSSKKIKIMELGISQNAATAGVYGLGRPAAIGITPTSPLTALDEGDGSDGTGTMKCAVAWGTAPTVPTNFFRRISCPATIGAGVIWSFPRGLSLPTSGTVVIWYITTSSALDAYVVADE